MAGSIHDKLQRVRKPRVHIRFDVEKLGQEPLNDLPFLVGIMGDYTGNNPGKDPGKLADRKFINIDRDNFDDVMKRMAPGLNLRVKNTLQDDNTEMSLQLKFESMDDFKPANVAKQVEPLRKLLETREKLKELLVKVDLSPKAKDILDQILANEEKLAQAATEANQRAPKEPS